MFISPTPGVRLQPTSVPATRQSKIDVLRRPQSSSFPRNNTRPAENMPRASEVEKEDWRSSLFGRKDDPSGQQASPAVMNSEMGTVKSSFLRRMSTFSSFHTDGRLSLSRPGTPSVAISIGSSTPIIPASAAPITPRNRLVKRATSQRVLHSGTFEQPSHSKSTLRRPATSHQRSADLQEQLYQNTSALQHDDSRPSFQQDDDPLAEDHDRESYSTQQWQPLFRSRHSSFRKDSPLKHGIAVRNNGRNGLTRSIVPVAGDQAILTNASSISRTDTDELSRYRSPTTHTSSPFNPLMSAPIPNPSPTASLDEAEVETDLKPRSSFSLSEFFSSPSPSTWKLPRTGSLRRKRAVESVTSGRRTASAPLPSNGRRTGRYPQPGPAMRSYAPRRLFGSSHGSDVSADSDHPEPFPRSPSSPLPPLNRLSAFEIDLPGAAPSYPSSPQPQYKSSPSSQTSPSLATFPNPMFQSGPRFRPSRPSGAPSDRASTLVGSDTENSRIMASDGDEMDYRSETMYDSVRTGATGSSHSGVRGPRIENVFEESPPPELLKQNLTALQEKLSHTNALQDFIAEEEESIRTPVRMAQSFEDDLPTPSQYPEQIPLSPGFASSPPAMRLTLKHGLVTDQSFENSHADEDWSVDDPEPLSWDDDGEVAVIPVHDLPKQANQPDQIVSTPRDSSVSIGSICTEERPRSNLFDWSERSPFEEKSQGPSPRPKTVHGKQETERGSRSAGRRGVNSSHLRSQSVPLPPDNAGHRTINNPSKLDAWVLNKGASEDWDCDFEFDEPTNSVAEANREGKADASVTPGMLVPRAILERQASVHGQFGQVKELTLLVEELKKLRQQAIAHDILHGQASELWVEAEGIIDLATLDDEEQDHFAPRSPNSPSFESDLFDDDTPASQRRPKSHLSDVSEAASTQQERSVTHQGLPQSSPTPPSLGTPPHGRPRKESVAKAKSVLEHIHQQRSSLDPPLKDNAKSPQKKLAFDTTSLRDLVTRAGVVTRALKEIIRKLENPNESLSTPERTPSNPPDPPLSQIFQPPRSPPSASKSPRIGKSSSRNSFMGGSISDNKNDINGHMKIMTVV
ncbi:hypothetical protein MMC13_007660 [Lambiella insularis]|nr:hypothetical protein [Lambiella insularis]